MPKKTEKAIVHPIFKRSLDRTLPLGELEVFGENSDHLGYLNEGGRRDLDDLKNDLRDAIVDLRRDGSILQELMPDEAFKLTCVAAERALWIALDEMRKVEKDRASRRFYLANASGAVGPNISNRDDEEEGPDKAKRQIYGKYAYSCERTSGVAEQYPEEAPEVFQMPVRVDQQMVDLARQYQLIASKIIEMNRVFDYLQRSGALDGYLRNSDISGEELSLAESLLKELRVGIDPDAYFSMAGLLEFIAPRRDKLEDGRRARVFERHFVLELFPLWIILTGNPPRDRDQKFIQLVNAAYRVFAMDPEELEAEMARLPKMGKVALWEWTTPLDWAAAEFRKSHPPGEG